jgi:hypothetical protein
VKCALTETLHEEPGLLRAALEDIALGRAIAEGMKTKTVSRDQVFATLRRKKA